MSDHPPGCNIITFNGNYEELVNQVNQAPGLVVVDFYATWCPPCKRLGDQLPTLAHESPKVTFLKVDIDQSRDLATHYQINSIPHLRFLRRVEQGTNQIQELATVTGADFQQIRAKIQQFGQ